MVLGARNASRGDAARRAVIDATGNEEVHTVVGDLLGILLWPVMASVQRGAETAVWAANASSLTDTTGKYFKRHKEMGTESSTRDADLAKRLWEETERIMRS